MHARVALPHIREKSADNPSSTCERCDCQQAGPRHGGTTLLYLRGLMGTSATLISSAVFFAPAPASMRAAGDRMLSPASDSAHTAVLGRHVALSPRPDSAGRRFDALGLAWKALPGERVNAQTSRFPRLRERPTQGERVAKESGAVRKWQRARGRDAERKGEPNSHAALEPRRRLPRTPRRRPSTPRRRLQVDGAG